MLSLCCFHSFYFILHTCVVCDSFYKLSHIYSPFLLFFFFFSLCLLPTLKLLAKIYKMPLKPIFLSGRLVNLPRRVQEQSASSEDGIECVLSDFDDDTGKCIESSKCGINQLLLPRVTVNFANCWKQKGGEKLHSLLSPCCLRTHVRTQSLEVQVMSPSLCEKIQLIYEKNTTPLKTR